MHYSNGAIQQPDLHGIWTLQIVDKVAAQTQFLTLGFLPPTPVRVFAAFMKCF